MIRLLRALDALMEIRGEMPWEDDRVHDWDPNLPGCPYRMLSAYLDEFLSAARHGDYGAEIMDLAEKVSVKGRKYGIGITGGGQSIYVQDGFTQLLCENLRENCIPVVLKVAPGKVGAMFKTLGIPSENTPDPLPRSFSPEEAGRIERVMRGEPEPPADSNTGGAGWIVEAKQPEVLRTLYMDFKNGLDDYFPDAIATLTDYEIRELEARDLWFDWTEPPRPGEFGPEPGDDEDGEDDGAPKKGGGGPRRGGGKSAARRDAVTSPARRWRPSRTSPASNPTPAPSTPQGPAAPAGPCSHLEGHIARGRLDLRRRPARHRRLRPHPGRLRTPHTRSGLRPVRLLPRLHRRRTVHQHRDRHRHRLDLQHLKSPRPPASKAPPRPAPSTPPGSPDASDPTRHRPDHP